MLIWVEITAVVTSIILGFSSGLYIAAIQYRKGYNQLKRDYKKLSEHLEAHYQEQYKILDSLIVEGSSLQKKYREALGPVNNNLKN